MATTYDPNVIATSPKDQVRFLIGDVAAPWSFTDEEIQGLLVLHGRPCKVAVFLARRKAANLAVDQGGSVSIGDTSVSEGDSAGAWREFANAIDAWCSSLMSMSAIGKRADGSSWNDQPRIFRIGQHDAAIATVAWVPANDPRRPLPPGWFWGD